MKKIILFPLITALISLAWVSSAIASSSKPTSEEKKVILIGLVESDYDVQIAKKALKKAGYAVEFTEAPWARCLEEIKNGKADILANVFEKPERKEFMIFGSEPIFQFKQFLYVPKDSNIVFNGNLNKLKNYTIGTRIGFSYGPKFDNAEKSGLFKTDKIATLEQNLQKLNSKRIDMFVESPMNLIAEFGKDNIILKSIKFLTPPISNQSSYIVISKKNKFAKKLSHDLDKSLKEMKKDGSYNKILKEIFGDSKLE